MGTARSRAAAIASGVHIRFKPVLTSNVMLVLQAAAPCGAPAGAQAMSRNPGVQAIHVAGPDRTCDVPFGSARVMAAGPSAGGPNRRSYFFFLSEAAGTAGFGAYG